jgi:predicted acylesterase/phospholipase RssA
LKYVDTYCGVSIGAIISLLIIAGYEIREIVGEATYLDIFSDFGPFNFQYVSENKGIISNEPLKKRLTHLILNKFGNVPTLNSLYMKTGKSFVITTLNINDEQCVMMDPFTYPDMSCIDAAMFSLNIPFIYQLIYQGKTYIDGSLANPYPVNYFDNNNTNILGISMKILYSNHDTKSYSSRIIYLILNQRRNHMMSLTSDKCRHICMDAINSNNRTTHEKAQLLVDGYNDGKIFLEQLKNTSTHKINDIKKFIYPPHYLLEDEKNPAND